MRRLLICALALFPVSAIAADDDRALIERYYELFGLCQTGETSEGRELTRAESDAACVDRDTVIGQLLNKGYCWNRSEQEWWHCDFAGY